MTGAPVHAARLVARLLFSLTLLSGELMAQQPQSLVWITPNQGDIVDGDNALLWVTEKNLLPSGDSVVFDASTDGVQFIELPFYLAPDLGPESHSSAFDASAFPTGPLYLRARFSSTGITSPVIQVTIQRRLMQTRSSPDLGCGCKQITLRTKGRSTIDDPRRMKLGEENALARKAPLGAEPKDNDNYVSYNFEVNAELTPGSDASKCIEGQLVKGTADVGGEKVPKRACSAGLELASCEVNSDCDIPLCDIDDEPCLTDEEEQQCEDEGGTCSSAGTGKCDAFPFSGNLLGNDDFRSPTDFAIGFKKHLNQRIVWLDPPGLAGSKQKTVVENVTFDGEFVSAVSGDSDCSCHFQLSFAWDGKKGDFDRAVLTLMHDAATKNCKLE